MPKKRKGAAEEQAVREARPEIDLEATRTPSGRGYLGPMPSQLAPGPTGRSPIAESVGLAEQCAELEGQLYGTPRLQAISTYEGATHEELVNLYNRLQDEWRLRLQENR